MGFRHFISLTLTCCLMIGGLVGCQKPKTDDNKQTDAPQTHADITTAIQTTTANETTVATTAQKQPILSDRHVRIACIGDSLTYGECLNAGRSENPYPKVLQSLLGTEDYTVEGFGKQGGVLSIGHDPRTYSSTTQYQDSMRFKPDVVILCLGTNDATRADLTTQSGKDNFRAGLENLLTAYRRIGVTAFYVCLPPYNENAARQSNMINLVIPQLKELCEEFSLPVLDLFTPTNGKSQYLLSDTLHLTDEGYAYMAQLVYERLETDMVGKKFAK